MKPTLIKKCCYIPANGGDVVALRIDPKSKDLKFPEFALVYEDDKYLIKILPDFISDGMSIPRLVFTLTGLTPFNPKCIYGAFIHDSIYQSHLLTQKQADIILDKILQIKPSPNYVQRQLVYYSLRAFGHIAYKSKSSYQIGKAKQYVNITIK